MDTWSIINLIGDVIIAVLCLVGTMIIVSIVLLVAGFIMDRRHQRAQPSQDEYDGLHASLLNHALRLAQELKQ